MTAEDRVRRYRWHWFWHRAGWLLVCIIFATIAFLVFGGALYCDCRKADAAGLCWPSNVTRWTRVGCWYEVKHDGQDLFSVARYLLEGETPQEAWLLGQELAAIRGVSAATVVPQGTLLRVAQYRQYKGARSRYQTVGMRSYHLSVMYGMRFAVRPSLLVGMRLQEGGNRLTEYLPWGVMAFAGHGSRVQCREAARIVRRHANRYGWDGWAPEKWHIHNLGWYYRTGEYQWWSASKWAAWEQAAKQGNRDAQHKVGWGNNVWVIMQRAEGE